MSDHLQQTNIEHIRKKREIGASKLVEKVWRENTELDEGT